MPDKAYPISDREIEILAHRLLPEIKKFFANEEIRKEFETWKTKRYEHNYQKLDNIE